uniref:helix-turn-helix domain-containing protein n=1 Tax=Marinobacterium profundum TaxID=1714300 RepID=UPI000836BF4A|nr:helix-turn-helix domain-containing protein [Marinobacterium profundum]
MTAPTRSRTSSDQAQIPHFSLYGEAGTIEDPAFVHIENITSRSSAHGWIIKPHRHGRMFQMICMFSGGVEVQLDEKVHKLEGPWAITIPPGSVHGFCFKPETLGMVLTLAEPMLSDASYSRSRPYFEPLLSTPMTIAFEQDGPQLAQLQRLLRQIESELNCPDTGRALMCEWLAHAVLMTLRRQLDLHGLSAEAANTPSATLAAFRQQVEAHFRDHWTVVEYANSLGTSAARLNRLCKQLLDKTAKAVPQSRLLLEAKRRLIYTRSNLDEIAYDLGFQDPAYFSRFFKRATGLTPGRFRSENNFDTTPE